jgi:iron complex transport system substrate-binding protein
MRIVSLLASGTELVVALGLGDCLVGRSHECDHPPWVKRLPALSRPTFDITGTSAEVDARVRERLHAGAPLYEIDEAQLAALAPHVILTQTHCEVCAVSPADLVHGAAAARLERRQVVALSTGTIDSILDGFLRVAEVLAAADAGRALVDGLRARLAAVAEVTRPLGRPRVACLEWIEPLFAMGNWGPEIADLAGGAAVFGTPGVPSTTLPFEALREADPEAIVIAPCGFDLGRTLAEIPTLTARAGWFDLQAVRAGRAFAADGNLFFNRSGPMLFETPELLAEMLHPAHFPARHQGRWWRRLPARPGGRLDVDDVDIEFTVDGLVSRPAS